jgi:hypothetical protein
MFQRKEFGAALIAFVSRVGNSVLPHGRFAGHEFVDILSNLGCCYSKFLTFQGSDQNLINEARMRTSSSFASIIITAPKTICGSANNSSKRSCSNAVSPAKVTYKVSIVTFRAMPLPSFQVQEHRRFSCFHPRRDSFKGGCSHSR